MFARCFDPLVCRSVFFGLIDIFNNDSWVVGLIAEFLRNCRVIIDRLGRPIYLVNAFVVHRSLRFVICL